MVSARIAAAVPLRTRMAAASAPRTCRKRISDKQGGQQSFHRTKDSPLIEQQPPSLLVFSAAREILSTRVEYTIHMQKVCVKESSRMPATFLKKKVIGSNTFVNSTGYTVTRKEHFLFCLKSCLDQTTVIYSHRQNYGVLFPTKIQYRKFEAKNMPRKGTTEQLQSQFPH